jgi:predicted dehydrogenase
MTSSLRVALVGAGAIARRVHLPYLTAHPRIGEVLVLDTDPAAARRAATSPGVRAHHGDLGGAGADLAVICTPPRSHAALIAEALDAGMHVVCEKPLVTSGTGAETIERLSRTAGRRVFACYTNRFRPDVELLRALIRDGELGRVEDVSATWVRRAGIPGTPGGWESGVLWDLGAHLVDLALWCTGWSGPATAFATGTRPQPGVETARADWYHDGDDAPSEPVVAHQTVAGLVSVGDGTLRIRASWHSAVPADSVTIRVQGTTGVAEIRTVFGFSPDRQTVTGPCLRVFHDRHGWRDLLVDQPRRPDEYHRQLDAAVSADSPDNLRSAVRSVALCEALDRSLHDGRTVTVNLSEDKT